MTPLLSKNKQGRSASGRSALRLLRWTSRQRVYSRVGESRKTKVRVWSLYRPPYLQSRIAEDHVLALNAQISSVADLVSPLSYGTEASAKQIAQYSTNLLMEGLPELLKVLQDVASAYPFIARESPTGCAV